MNAKKSGAKVGLTLLGGLVLLYGALVWLRGDPMPGKKLRRIAIRFENVNGLMPGDPVKVRGVVYGKVTDIQPHATHVMVYATIPDSFPLQSDAYAVLQSKEVLSGKQVSLYPGQQQASLAQGAVLPGEFVPDVSTAYEWLQSTIKQADTVRIRRALTEVESLLAAGADAATLLPELKATLTESRRLMASLGKTAALAEELPVKQLVLRTDSLMRRADRALTTTERLISRTDSLMAQAQPLVPQVKTTLDQASRSLSTVDSLLAQADGLMGKIPDSLDYTIYNLNETLRMIRERKLHVTAGLGSIRKAAKN